MIFTQRNILGLLCTVSILLNTQLTHTAVELIPTSKQCSTLLKTVRSVSGIGLAILAVISAYKKYNDGDKKSHWEVIRQLCIGCSETMILCKMI